MFVVGDRVIARNTDNRYYRGRVTEINNGLIKILLDNGIEISVSDESKVIEDTGLTDAGVTLGMHVIVPEESNKIGFVTRKTETRHTTQYSVNFDIPTPLVYYDSGDLRAFPDHTAASQGKCNKKIYPDLANKDKV